MCVIAYKPENVSFPSKNTLKICFNNNPDGAGYMFAAENKVHIVKGLMTFGEFYKSLKASRKRYGDNVPYVLHWRISTQAGLRPDCTHPFPLSGKMADLRKLKTTCGIGVAHNGIISLTSSGFSKTITYNDTMEFISDYLSLIIRGPNYYKSSSTLKLIERLSESKLAILDGRGHCELIGNGWVEDNGVMYSNSTFKKTYTTKLDESFFDGWESRYDGYWPSKSSTPLPAAYTNDHADYYEGFYDACSGSYMFDGYDCPYVTLGDDGYCLDCHRFDKCFNDTPEEYTISDYVEVNK